MATGEQTGADQDGAADPDALAAEIERTRDELAGTLDAIADKVSPKRVASRTGKKVATKVKDGAASVKEGAAAAKDAVAEAVTDALPDSVAARLADGGDAKQPEYVAPSVSSIQAPALGGSAYDSSGLPRKYLAAGAAAAVLAILVLRRRRR